MSAGREGGASMRATKERGKAHHSTPQQIYTNTQSHNNTYNKSSIPIPRLLIQLASIQQFQQIKNIFFLLSIFISWKYHAYTLPTWNIVFIFNNVIFNTHTNTLTLHTTYTSIFIYIHKCTFLFSLFSCSSFFFLFFLFVVFSAFFQFLFGILGLLLDSKKNSNYIYYSANIVSSAHARL